MIPVFVPLGEETLLRAHYGRKLQKHGMQIVPVYYQEPWETQKSEIKKIYDKCDGVLLIGGTDFHPYRYGKSYNPNKVKDPDDTRDIMDLTTLDWLILDEKPSINICRGAQALAIHQGLKLNPHIPDDLPNYLEVHSREEVPTTLASISNNKIKVEKNTRLYGILGKEEVDVKCAHHQGIIYEPKKNLIASARSKMGIIEAIERDHPTHFCIGVQFHPELGEGITDKIFEAFKQECEKYKARR